MLWGVNCFIPKIGDKYLIGWAIMKMKKTILYLSVLFLMFICTGCANIEGFSAYKFKLSPAAARLAGVNIVIDKVDDIPDDDLLRFQYQHRMFLQDTLYRSLKDKNIFCDISTWPNKYLYTLKISYGSKIVCNNCLYGAEMMISAATIFMIPVKKTQEYCLKVDLFFGSKKIKTYYYKDVLKSFSHISNDPRDEESIEIDKLVKLFLTDLYTDGLLPKDAR